ncbi:MAG: right-handed parallel beta-helix repeat-containing protein [bacterium]|nr:right-handed parallel beta-helix repeat-containing protein [bacterium]
MTIHLQISAAIVIGCLAAASALAQATIDESTISQVLYASPTGSDANNGWSTNAPKTLNGAITAANSVASKIILLDGDYRQWVSLPAGTNILVLEAQHTGAVAITGSDIVTNWSSLGGGLYALPWLNNWGMVSSGFPGTWTAYNRRMEMVFIDGARLLQKCDASGNPVATNTLLAGEFTVDEATNRITFRPPTGVTLSASNKVEVAMRGNSDHLFKATERSNLVLRGLTFRHHAGAINQKAAASIAGYSGNNAANPSRPAAQILIEDCTFIENNAVGLNLAELANVSLSRVNASSNGSRGGGFFATQHADVSDCRFNANNWRTAPINAGHDAAGFKMFDGQLNEYTDHGSADVLFLRCAFRNNNSVGFWQDYGGTNVTLDACMFENNEQGGVMNEMTPGPFTVKNSVVRHNGSFGVMSYGSPNVRLYRNILYGTRASSVYNADPQYCAEIMLVLDNRVNSALVGTNPTLPTNADGHFNGWTIAGNSIQATNTGGVPLFYATDYGSSSNPNWPCKRTFVTTVTSDSNYWWRAAGKGLYTSNQGFHSAINYSDWRNGFTDLTFSQWQAQSNVFGRQDMHSTWGAVDLSNVADPTFTGSISGTITNSTTGTAAATVVVSSGTCSATTDVNGAFSFSNVTNGTYTLTPTLGGYTFSPATRQVAVNGADQPGQDFAGVPEPALLLPLLLCSLKLKG